MRSTDFDQISAAADHLAINHRRGKYHKPVALVWAIDRAVSGLPRLATAAIVRSQLDSLPEQLTGVESNAAWPWLKLANDLGSAWRVDGADPSEDPPVDFVAGWSRSAYLAIEGNPDLAGQLIENVLDQYLSDVRNTVTESLASDEPAGVHRRARGWAPSRRNLLEREGDDRLWDGQGQSYKVKGRTGSMDKFGTSFDLRHDHDSFDFLVPVVLDPEGDVIRAALVDRETFDRFAHENADSVRFRISRAGPEIGAVQWLVGP
jgi:hypothetical protein